MVIQLDEWKDWRIAGGDISWELQKLVKDKGTLDGFRWQGFLYFSSLHNALEAAYEKTLRDSRESAPSMRKAVNECKRVKDALKEAVDAARE